MKRLRTWLSHKIAPAPPSDWLDYYTGHNAVYWVTLIQQRIQETWQPNPADPNHPIQVSPAKDWIGPIAQEVEHAIHCHDRMHGDENIAGAVATALVLTTWGVRIAHAKTFDPHRPLDLRQASYRGWMNLQAAFTEALIDESRDPTMFDQPWESPWVSDATDGSFV